MADTYCGKTCAECPQKETLNCPGCKDGPGRPCDGDCVLAKCARSKNHETCATCSGSGTCGIVRGRFNMPERRIQRLTAEADRKNDLASRAPVIGKWLWLLFWMFIPNGIAGVLTNSTVAEAIPALIVPGKILDAICALAFGGIMLQLTTQDKEYRIPGIFWMITGAIRLLDVVSQDIFAGLVIALAAAITGLVGQFKEFDAHSSILSDVEPNLSEKWLVLRRWIIILYCGMIGGAVLMGVMPSLGGLLGLAVNIGLIVVGILRIVYLYRTAQEFRYYRA